jgi:hypothetical protein
MKPERSESEKELTQRTKKKVPPCKHIRLKGKELYKQKKETELYRKS